MTEPNNYNNNYDYNNAPTTNTYQNTIPNNNQNTIPDSNQNTITNTYENTSATATQADSPIVTNQNNSPLATTSNNTNVVDNGLHDAQDNPFDDPNQVVDNQTQYQDYTNMYTHQDNEFSQPANPNESISQLEKEEKTTNAAYAQSAEPSAGVHEPSPREHHHHHHHHSSSLHLSKGDKGQKSFQKMESSMDNILGKTDEKVGKPIVNFSTKVNDTFTKLFHLK